MTRWLPVLVGVFVSGVLDASSWGVKDWLDFPTYAVTGMAFYRASLPPASPTGTEAPA